MGKHLSMVEAELRDYFAAHAPDEIPHWFTGPALPEPHKPVPPPEIADYVRKWWFDEEPSDLLEYLPDDAPIEHQEMAVFFQQENADHWEATEQRRKDLVVSRYFAWRWNYAEMMLKHKPNPPDYRPYKPLDRS